MSPYEIQRRAESDDYLAGQLPRFVTMGVAARLLGFTDDAGRAQRPVSLAGYRLARPDLFPHSTARLVHIDDFNALPMREANPLTLHEWIRVDEGYAARRAQWRAKNKRRAARRKGLLPPYERPARKPRVSTRAPRCDGFSGCARISHNRKIERMQRDAGKIAGFLAEFHGGPIS